MNPHQHPHGGPGADGLVETSASVLPVAFGMTVLLISLLALTAFLLWRSGRLTLPTFGGSRSPENEAKRILAERFARGDLDSNEFLERASILNWSPGTDPVPAKAKRK